VIERVKTRTRSGRRRKRKGGRAEKKREREGKDPINAVVVSSIEESEQILVSESLGRELR
jgi:hypothetical protein